MRAIRLFKDERGANAIEYSLIGAFLGIGIIAALTGTRTSLNTGYTAIVSGLGTVAAGGSSGATTPPAPVNPVTSQRAVAAANTSSRYAFWSGKTMTSKSVTNPTPGSQQTTFAFADGTSGTYVANYDSTGKLLSEVVTVTPSNFAGRLYDSTQFTYGADGSQQSMIYTDRYANGVTKQVSTSSASGGWIETVKGYDSNGNFTGQGTYPATGSGVLANGAGDEVYFRALANQ